MGVMATLKVYMYIQKFKPFTLEEKVPPFLTLIR